jgi:hypothetical protein
VRKTAEVLERQLARELTFTLLTALDVPPRPDASCSRRVEDHDEGCRSLGQFEAFVRPPVRGGEGRVYVESLQSSTEPVAVYVEQPCGMARFKHQKVALAKGSDRTGLRLNSRSHAGESGSHGSIMPTG